MDTKVKKLRGYLEKKNRDARIMEALNKTSLKLEQMSKPEYWVELREAKKLEQKQRDFNIKGFVKAMVKNQ